MFLVILLTATLSAQPLRVREEKVFTRDAWVLENGVIRLAALKGGGHLAEIRLLSPDPKKSINPMRVPHYPTIDPHTFDDAIHTATYGADPHRWLSSGYMGHLLCFPFYGPPSSKEEIAAGLGNHGEAPIVAWHKLGIVESGDALTFRYAADLPKTQYQVERAITIFKAARHIRIVEIVENMAGFDRPFQWMQHATFGDPFVEPGKTFLDAPVLKALTAGRGTGGSLMANTEMTWPTGKDPEGNPVSLRVFQPREKAGTYAALVLDPKRESQYFTLYHSGYQVLIGYVYPTSQNPWLADWQENKSNQVAPWNGKVVARGLEFGNSPFAEGLKKAVERGSLYSRPAYQWIGARQRLKNEYTIFLEEVTENFAGVEDVVVTDGIPRLTKRTAQ